MFKLVFDTIDATKFWITDCEDWYDANHFNDGRTSNYNDTNNNLKTDRLILEYI